jgi:DNA-binding Xre family transcriptional regulator
MAQRWSLNEDIIVCKYCIENPWAYSSYVDLEFISEKLANSGFETRSRTALRKRAYAYEMLIEKRPPSNIPRQVLIVYETIAHEREEIRQCVKGYIKEHYDPNESTEISNDNEPLSELLDAPNNLMGYQYTIDNQQTFPMVLQKYVELKKIKKHKDMCKSIGMKPDTFSSLLCGKYRAVKKDNVLRLCVGLHLSVSEAEELLNSAGFMLSNAIMTDVVIKAFLWNRIYGVVAINMELEENNAPKLFHDFELEYEVI